MSYVAPEFALFFLLFAPTYFACPGRYRWLLLLVASYAFYIYGNAQYTLVLALLTLATYISARLISLVTQQRTRAIFLSMGIGINLGMLILFKFAGFFLANTPATNQQTQSLKFFLPLGISFYTFQQIAYLVDVYRNRIKPEPHLGIFAVFTSFFPTVSSGPIERAGSLIPQLRSRVTFDEVAAVEGLRLVLWGLFKKVVLTNSLAVYVDSVYNSPQSYTGLPLAIATFFYAFQIYGDFSAYSDIAVGIARILGFKLTINFRQPYFSLSVREFWQRWHISLSTWIRDYLFFPFNRLLLGISKGRSSRLIQLTVNLLVMGIVGLWHGASWTFIVWGLIHGLYLTVESFFGVSINQQTSPFHSKLFRAGLTFALVSCTWIFFRANNFADALYIVTHLVDVQSQLGLAPVLTPLAGSRMQFLTAVIAVISLLIVDGIDARWGINQVLNRSPRLMRWSVYYAVAILILVWGSWGKTQFIYFQF